MPIGRRSSHLLWDESQFAELLITSTAESKPGEGEQLSAHLHITRPARRGREGERRRYGDGGGRRRRRVGERWKRSDTKAQVDGGGEGLKGAIQKRNFGQESGQGQEKRNGV